MVLYRIAHDRSGNGVVAAKSEYRTLKPPVRTGSTGNRGGRPSRREPDKSEPPQLEPRRKALDRHHFNDTGNRVSVNGDDG